jgi:ABC-type branched-subunit amino acid transport system ATPase component
MTAEFALKVEQATVRLGNRVVLNAIDLFVQPGEIVSLLGHNGAGKSTLLRCIIGSVPLETGVIRLGFGSWQPNSHQLGRFGVYYLPQNEKLFKRMTVQENLRVFADALQIKKEDFEQRYAELIDYFPVLHSARTTEAARLSGGESQQVAFARTMFGKPRLLLLDEPSIGLAQAARNTVFELVLFAAKSLGAAVVLAEHRVREALEISQRVYVLRQGVVANSASSQEFLEHSERLQDLIV